MNLRKMTARILSIAAVLILLIFNCKGSNKSDEKRGVTLFNKSVHKELQEAYKNKQKSNTSTAKDIVGPFYQKLLTCFPSFDASGNLSWEDPSCDPTYFLDNKVVLIHQGPKDSKAPYYDTFTGIDGFKKWWKLILENFGFQPVCTSLGFDVRYMIGDSNQVDTSVLESGNLRVSQNNICIENFHHFKVNKDGKINFILVISESQTVLDAIYGPSGTYKTKYESLDYKISNPADADVYTTIATKAIDFIIKSNYPGLKNLIADDIVIIAGGKEGVVPFAGKFDGQTGANSFVDKIKIKSDLFVKPGDDFSLTEKGNNKADVYYYMKGEGDVQKWAIFSCQFDEKVKIKYIYLFYDTGFFSRVN